MKTTLLLFGFLGLFIGAHAAKVISGIVYDETKTPLPGVSIVEKGTTNGTTTNMDGEFTLSVRSENAIVSFMFIGCQTQEIAVKGKDKLEVVLKADMVSMDEVAVVGFGKQSKKDITGALSGRVAGVSVNESRESGQAIRIRGYSSVSKSKTAYCLPPQPYPVSTEDYASFNENKFLDPKAEPLSTFSVDVDRASYSNVRRFINQGSLPPVDAVRIEEMINYFNYNYAGPKDNHPFAIHQEVAACPWNEQHYLMKVALQGKRMEKENLPPSNLVFLLDVSGSMRAANKLPLLKSALKMLVNELRDEDKVSIVVYAGAAGVVLEPTSGNEKRKIIEALDKLNAGGSTAGGAGLKLAYKMAHKNLLEESNNRIILTTDGDFNVGVSSNSEMEKLIEGERDNGIFITVAGFGMGNYKDSKMEIIADKGNGNYFYIDNIQEARKALVEEFGGTLYTIAKDVKFQLEFNPMHVAGYRLIGYENRLLNKEDFNDDKKDAGEIGAGHTVTALYEIIPLGAEDIKDYVPGVDALKYQASKKKEIQGNNTYSDELLTLKLRYKQPDAPKSTLLVETVKNKVLSYQKSSSDFKFTASVAAWGMKLRNSDYIENVNYDDIIKWAKASRSEDKEGYRAEMIRLMESAQVLADAVSLR
ncbi:YfbK domain-containing protein [Saccharicrinis sp. 156]|uniref:vWA domain-containing protein n=1 Tax=Saccharicrinis sp. 156 TaxID=3417574 RepID=UPI003D34A5A2